MSTRTVCAHAGTALQDVWGRPSAADVGESDTGFRSFGRPADHTPTQVLRRPTDVSLPLPRIAAAQDADAVFGTGPAEPLSPWLGADPAQPVSPWLLGAGAANEGGGIAPSPFFSGRSGQLGSLNGQSTPSQQVGTGDGVMSGCRSRMAHRVRPRARLVVNVTRLQPQFSSPPGRAARASTDASTVAVDAFALAAADASMGAPTVDEMPAAIWSGLADLGIRAGLAALIGSVRVRTAQGLTS